MEPHMKRMGWLTALIVLVGIAATAQVAPTSAVEAAFNASLCASAKPIPAEALPSRVNLKTCPIEGRLIVLKLPNGKVGPGLHVPRPGLGVGIADDTTGGEYTLTVMNSRGWATISFSDSANVRSSATQKDLLSSPTLTSASTDPACSEAASNWEGPLWNQSIGTDAWYYNESTSSRAGLSGSATLSDIRQAVYNLTNGVNNCGWAESGWNVRGAYKGTTSLYANINQYGKCTSRFPDGQNTVSWGPYDSSVAGTLADTCWTYKTDSYGVEYFIETDIYIGSNVNIVDTYPTNCTSSYDLQTVVIHEWGHAFGLAHEYSGTDEVMYPYKTACQNRRHLGEGDYTGMASLYP
jgi:hypothetical protein